MTRTMSKDRHVPDSSETLLAAASEFALNGFAGASVEAIAARAGVNKAMIYLVAARSERCWIDPR